jgi:hypothetical protein
MERVVQSEQAYDRCARPARKEGQNDRRAYFHRRFKYDHDRGQDSQGDRQRAEQNGQLPHESLTY